MQVQAKFFIGTFDYGVPPPSFTKEELSDMAICNLVGAALEAATVVVTLTIIKGTLPSWQNYLTATSYEADFAAVTDKPTLPQLLYVDAFFEVPEDLAHEVEAAQYSLEDIFTAELRVAGYSFGRTARLELCED
jgi:hypothetical protein